MTGRIASFYSTQFAVYNGMNLGSKIATITEKLEKQ